MTQTYRVNSQDIMHETIEGEVVIVNLDSGAYYAFDGSGEYIWDRLSTVGASQQQLVGELAQHFSASVPEIQAGVQHFFAQLVDEALIVPVDDTPGPATAAAARVERGGAFVAPQLHKYTDMEALLLADPIHEVEADGWPNLRTQ